MLLQVVVNTSADHGGATICKDVSVQTVETALAVCSQCDHYHQALLEISARLRPSPLSTKLVTTGRILHSIFDDLDSLEADRKSTQQQCQTHLARIAEQDCDLEELRTECNRLHSNITALEVELTSAKEKYEVAITRRDSDHSRELERAMSALQAEQEMVASLRKEVSSQRAKLDASQLKQGK